MKVRQPASKTTWNDYKERILRVLMHIQEHLDETLDLEELAQVACFSSFHFHRIFAAMTGETIADHVRRLRLERAALELRSGAKQVIQVALDAGYEAHEAFTRAFKVAYGIAPARFRRTSTAIPVLAAPSGVHYGPGVPLITFNTNHITTKAMKVITKKIKPMRVAYLRHIGPYENVSQTWIDLTSRLSADKQVRKRSVFIGIGHDNPSATPASELRYDACITIDGKYEPSAPVAVQTIAGGDCAIAKNCPVGKIKDAFQYLFGKWIVRSSRELRPAPSFIVMVDAHNAVAPVKRRVDIYMPLQPKTRAKKPGPITIEVKKVKPKRVAFIRHVGPYTGVQHTWIDLTERLKKEGRIGKKSVFIGVPHDNPKQVPPEKLRYDACVTVDEKYAPTKPVGIQTIAGGDYVVVRNCAIGGIAKGYERLFGTWLPESGRKVKKNTPSFLEAVRNNPQVPAFGFTDIYVPLEPKA